MKNKPLSSSHVLKKRAAKQMLNFLHLAENLKNELRHSHTSKGRHESVAEHSWRAVLMAVLLKQHLNAGLDWERLLGMIVIHDLAEARTGDVPIFDTALRKAGKGRERVAMEEFRSLLPTQTGEWIFELWTEFEANQTMEAKIANALDKLEAQIQHNEADLNTWIEWEKIRVFGGLDATTAVSNPIMRLKDEVVNEAVEKLIKGGEDIENLRKKANGSNRTAH